MKQEEEKRGGKKIEEKKSLPKLTIPSKSNMNETEETSKNLGSRYTEKLKDIDSRPIKSNIRRSHSAHNISQLHDEDTVTSPVVPTFDRTLKPPDKYTINKIKNLEKKIAQPRNFEAKDGRVIPGRTGLKNLGNTCYMNSIIQCLSNTEKLADFFHRGYGLKDVNENSSQGGEIAIEVASVIRILWSGNYKCIAMRDLKSTVGKYHKLFDNIDQQDSHEFLILLMDWLQDDLNTVRHSVPPMQEQNFEANISDHEAANFIMKEIKMRNNSVIDSLFHGLHRSVIACTYCEYRSLTFESFSVLTVSFPTSGRCSLRELLNDYYRQSQIEYTCEKCKKSRDCVRKLDIWRLPPVLIIHLNRFEQDVLMKKNQNYVDFPIEDLNVLEYTSDNVNRSNSYNLYAVSNHYGTMDGGHYTAYCKSKSTGSSTWLKFDDNEVYEMSRDSVRSSAAYILFYQTDNIS